MKMLVLFLILTNGFYKVKILSQTKTDEMELNFSGEDSSLYERLRSDESEVLLSVEKLSGHDFGHVFNEVNFLPEDTKDFREAIKEMKKKISIEFCSTKENSCYSNSRKLYFY